MSDGTNEIRREKDEIMDGQTAARQQTAPTNPAVQIALTVESLRQAENLYTQLFGMRVAGRDRGADGEAHEQKQREVCCGEDGNGVLLYNCVCPPDGAGVDEADDPRAFRRSVLEGDGFRLLLLVGVVDTASAAESATPFAAGRLAHVGLHLAPGDLEALRARAGKLACRVLADGGSAIVLEDPLGVRWRLAA